MMATLQRNLENRKWLLERLKAEIVGPDPSGERIDIKEGSFFSWDDLRKPKRQTNGEEILWQDSPLKRYGAGILFPQGVTEQRQLEEEAGSVPAQPEDIDSAPDLRVDELLEKRVQEDVRKIRILADDTENYDVALANSYRPAAMGVSFLADLSAEAEGVIVEVDFAKYKPVKVRVSHSRDSEFFTERDLWIRVPAVAPEGGKLVIGLSTSQLTSATSTNQWVPGFEGQLELVAISRCHGREASSAKRLLTICLVNRQRQDAGRIDELCFFQVGLRLQGRSSRTWILPYPEAIRANRKPDDEEEIIRLLYRERLTFGIGHGCAADWPGERPRVVGALWTDSMPTFETPGVSADIKDDEGKAIRVSMRKLAGLDPSDDGHDEVLRLVDCYEKWIRKLEVLDARKPPVPDDLKPTARILIERCRDCLNRIKDGLAFLSSGTTNAKHAREAFRLANHAMLVAQLRASREVRTPSWFDDRLVWDREIYNPDPAQPHDRKGYWRPFQIAFLLMSLQGICDPTHRDRLLVDLIWFPTGGGKTEAYLGLTAFTIFFNRLAGNESGGADVIMRYTLRLLTAQQFQRAALLFCAMEYVRRIPGNRERLGTKEFRLGMWVGGDATPNKRSEAKAALGNLQRNPDTENPFILLKCPWCNAKFGPADENSGGKSKGRGQRGGRQRSPLSVLGYTLYKPAGRHETVVFRCEDDRCEFGGSPAKPAPPLPIVIIDEDIFEAPPNLIIGTVDKFALLAWKPETRSIFGIGEDGRHKGLPPSLIIQDELHLISGPLGSMVGAYETVIEELCTSDVGGRHLSPKIIASTATISRAAEQVQALYAREEVMLFPPSGLEAGDSFFAKEDRSDDGSLKPGRLYAGILAPGHGSLQTTEARTFAALLQYPAVMPVQNGDESERDPWWTLLAFFNSLRELGGAATLLVADARDYLRVIIDRHGYLYSQIRQLLNVEELTSRIRSDRIPLAIQKLEISFKRDQKGHVTETVEACLASNIIEVGVDIDRLGLMTIVGQPKTTSQYIQVSSRVGRSSECQGFVVVTFSQSKPRDRSHYERFRSYHQRLYAQVEPTSVTPFSPPAVDRALHGLIVAAARQLAPMSEAAYPRPFPLGRGTPLRKRVEEMIERRVRTVDASESGNVAAMMKRRLEEWKAWDPSEYGGFGAQLPSPPLIHPAGSREPVEWRGHSWSTLSSLRDVDATCEAEITSFYNEVVEEGNV